MNKELEAVMKANNAMVFALAHMVDCGHSAEVLMCVVCTLKQATAECRAVLNEAGV